MSKTNPTLVGILMGSDSDWPVMKAAAEALAEFGIGSRGQGHFRPPRPARAGGICCRRRAARGLKVIIAGAGGAAHLPGVTAAFTTLPVIGVPILGKAFDGFDSLLAIVQMPPGVPVATVAINGARNAGHSRRANPGHRRRAFAGGIEKIQGAARRKNRARKQKLT